MYAPFTPIEFFDASFHDGSEHTLWCLRVTGAVRFEKWEATKGYVVPPPKDDFVFESSNPLPTKGEHHVHNPSERQLRHP
jgi:hypothetical protein